jgi:predicted nucleotidyltransferase
VPPLTDTTALIAKATAILCEEGASEVFLFGSQADGTATEHSDLDLAVRGLPAERYFHTVGRLLMELRCPVDLISLDADSPFAQMLVQRGKLRRVA